MKESERRLGGPGDLFFIIMECLVVEMPLLAPLAPTKAPKLLTLFGKTFFFSIGVYLPGCGFMELFRFDYCLELLTRALPSAICAF